MSFTRARLVVAAALLTAMVTGCDGAAPLAEPSTQSSQSPAPTTSTPSAEGLAALPARKIFDRSTAALKAADSLRLQGSIRDDGEQMTIDLELARAGGQGSIAIGGVPVGLKVIGKVVYMQLSEAMLRQEAGSKAEADAAVKLLRGKWIKVTKLGDDDLRDMIKLMHKDTFVKEAFDTSGVGLKKTAPKIVDGVRCIGLADRGGVIWVDAENGRPIRLEAANGAGGRDVLRFSRYNQVSAPKPPPANRVLDGKAFGL